MMVELLIGGAIGVLALCTIGAVIIFRAQRRRISDLRDEIEEMNDKIDRTHQVSSFELLDPDERQSR